MKKLSFSLILLIFLSSCSNYKNSADPAFAFGRSYKKAESREQKKDKKVEELKEVNPITKIDNSTKEIPTKTESTENASKSNYKEAYGFYSSLSLFQFRIPNLDEFTKKAKADNSGNHNPWSIASLVAGILGVFMPLLAIFAIIAGIVALKQISLNPDQLGKGMATAGLILGSLTIFIWLMIIILFIGGGFFF